MDKSWNEFKRIKGTQAEKQAEGEEGGGILPLEDEDLLSNITQVRIISALLICVAFRKI